MTQRQDDKTSFLRFPHHGFDAYAVALDALEKADALAKKLPRGYGPLSDQLRRLHSPAPHGGAKSVRVVTRIRDHRLAVSLREQLVGHHHFVALARREREVERAALGVDDGVELCRNASSRASQSIAFDPPLPPDASC